MNLNELGLEHGTDKSSVAHDYLGHYESFLAPLRDKPIRLLEMGVLWGASLRMWRDYFTNGVVIGMDTDPQCEFDDPRVKIVKGDQSNVDDLERALKCGPFHIINDDAGHVPEHQIFALKTLLPTVAPGGFYILEDIRDHTVIDFCAKIARKVVWRVDVQHEWIAENAPRVEWVFFRLECCVFKIKD